MSKAKTFGLMIGMLALAGSARATVNADSAANYGGVWTNGSNGGGGFGAWSIETYDGAGWAGYGIWASSNADLSMGDVFGFVAKGDGAYINIDRPFSQAMSAGDVFSLDFGLNYDSGSGGNKGFALRTADNQEVLVVNQAGSQIVTVNGYNALTNYGTTAMHWTFTQNSATQLYIYATGRSGAETFSAFLNATVSIFISNIHFYASSVTNDEYAEQRQVYFDNLTLTQGASGTNLFTYTIESGKAIINSIATTAAGDIVIPSTLGGYPVGAIDRVACKDRTNVTGVSFMSGATVTRIGTAAFQGCTRLATFELPSALTEIPVGLFYGCTGLVSVTIPAGVTSIWDTAFADCRALASLALPTGLTFLSESAFLNCRSLTALDIPARLTGVAGQLCYECRSLASIGLPDGVTNIGYSAFYNCFGLTSLSIDNTLGSIGDQAFYGCENLRKVYFYGDVAALGESVFGNCESLGGVYFVYDPPAFGPDGGTNLFLGTDATVYYFNSNGWSATYGGAAVEFWRPTIAGSSVVSNTFRFTVEWVNGQNVKAQVCTNLCNPNWIDIGTNRVISAGACAVSDTNMPAGAMCYYRIKSAD